MACLNYDRCTRAELAVFMEARTGAPVTPRTLNGVILRNRLRDLDRELAFPRFLELPVEARFRVYKHLLTTDKVLVYPGYPKIHTAVLRTSKSVFQEAEPVLYKENRFEVAIKGIPGPRGFYELSILRPRRGSRVRVYSHVGNHGSVLNHMSARGLPDILRGLRSLTVSLRIGPTFTIKDAADARRMVACLCLLMCDGSKLKDLTFVLEPDHTTSRGAARFLAKIFWLLILLPPGPVVRFQGAPGVSGFPLPDRGEGESQRCLSSSDKAEKMSKIVANIRRCYRARSSSGRHGDPCWREGNRIPQYLRGVDGLLESLAPLAAIVDTLDIASGSPRWKRLQELADNAEAAEVLDE